MKPQHILIPNHDGLADASRPVVAELPHLSKVVSIEDGAQMVMAFVKIVSRETTPSLVVLDHRIERVRGRSCATAIRAIEKGLGIQKTPILFYTAEPADDEFKRFTSSLGQTLQLTRRMDKSIGSQARRLGKALNRILEKVGR